MEDCRLGGEGHVNVILMFFAVLVLLIFVTFVVAGYFLGAPDLGIGQDKESFCLVQKNEFHKS